MTPWTATHQASLPSTKSQSLLKLMSIESEMPSNHLFLCHPLLLLPLIFPSICVSSNKSALHIRWPSFFPEIFSLPNNSQINTYWDRLPPPPVHSLKLYISLQFLLPSPRQSRDRTGTVSGCFIYFSSNLTALPCEVSAGFGLKDP